MEAGGKHMLNEHRRATEMDSSVLDNFTSLASDNEKCRIEAGLKLLQHIFAKQEEFEAEGICPELAYALNRLIRGLASSRITARKGFYSALVGVLSTFSFLTMEDLSAVIRKELHCAKGSKSEEADIYAGHILVYGAMIKSDLLFKGTVEEQSEVMKSILEAGSKRSYLLLPSHTFVVSLLNKVDEQSYREYIWPVLKGVIKSLPELTLETFHYMLLSTVLHPGVVKKKLLLSQIGAPEIIHEESIQTCAKLLMTVRSFSDYSHPVHEDFCEHLSKSPLLATFWELGIEGQLEKPSESKKLIAVNMFYFVLKHVEDMSQVPTMLTPKFLDVVTKSLERVPKKLETKHDRLCARTHEVFTTFMLKILKEKKPKGKTIVKIITKLTFSNGGNFMFDRITGTRVVQNLLLLLKAHSVKKVANLFRDVISGSSDKCGGLDGEEPRPWNNKERMYAVDVYARILGLPAVVGDNEWKIEQLRFLLQVGFFYPSTQEQNQAHISPLLADSLKQSFFRVLNHRLPRMEDVRNLLITLVHDVDSMIAGDTFILRQPLAREALDAWQKLLSVSASLEQKIAEGKNVVLARVFHTMFQYMGLQLLTDPKLAQDALEELHSCFQRAENEQKEKKKKKKRKHSKEENKDEEEEEPVWVEVAVDLILSLLSQNSSIPRNMLDLFFFHLCPYLTGPALGQITQILDPDQEESPLSLLWNADDGESDEAESDDSESEESDSKQSDSDLEEGDNETVNDKLRMAVRDALGSAAPLTDTESVDIDDMDEAEGRRLDKALSEAFSMFKGTKTNKKSKKQQKDARVLMHFRIRAIDLLEIYLKSEHVGTEASLSSYIDIMLVLFSLLEFCIKDLHQKPLENRVRSCLKRLSSAKKCVSLEGVTEEIIAGALKQLMEKGERTSGPVFLDMGSKITECCTFLVRCSQRLKQQSVSSSSANDGTSPVTDIYKSALVTFFTKRDCLHQLGLFKSVLESVWDGNWTLVPILINYAFDPEVRPFRRNQALDLLVSFFRNRRLRTASEVAQEAEPKLVEIERLLSVRTVEWLQSQMSEVGKNSMGRGVKQKFVHELLVLLFAVWHSHPLGKNGGSNIDWESLGAALLKYREKVDLSAEAKISFNKLARVLGIKWIPQQKEKKLATKEGSSDLEDSSCDNAENDLSQEKNEEEETQNDVEVTEKSKKRDKKEKKRREKKNKQNKAKLRKEARELRLSSLSEGLENVTFSGLKRNVEVDKKEEDFVNEMCNGFVNSENKKKMQKRKSDEIEDTQRTSKKIK
ncbi:uncharacterized protein Mybbp1A [Periplaneta americana]|uniref:uncharacterized protein Mybbp1A n=1 Tax=Periplaneta americana TaxID=6978 RepID=UPI0037E8BE66